MIDKKHYYVTFGQSHTHRFNGMTLDCDIVLKVSAKNRETVHKWAMEMFDAKFGCIYEKLDMSYFPRGILEITI